MVANSDPRMTGTAQLSEMNGSLQLSSQIFRSHRVIFTEHLLSTENPILATILHAKPTLIVASESVDHIYGNQIRAYFDKRLRKANTYFMVLPVRERNKTIDQVLEICQRASRFNLERESQIIAIGGGVCTDICGMAASLYRRGIPYIKIPTTLVGLIDAGIATKNAVNFGGKKSAIGTFYPPECSILDSTFLSTLPLRHMRCGLAESLKMGIILDTLLYQMIATHGVQLLQTNFRKTARIGHEIIRRSVVDMLEELSKNLFEVGHYKRAVDFGHTFSPYVESVSAFEILHGEAVAIDMAISCQIANTMGILSDDDLERILCLIEDLGLPTFSSVIDAMDMWESLESISAHRDGQLNLVVPRSIGRHTFLENLQGLSPQMLSDIIDRLERRNA